jgi:heme-binding protein
MKAILRVLKWPAISLAVIFLGIQFIRPARTNPPVNESQTIFARTQMTPQVAAIFTRSCIDCHSNKTSWPWYSNVAPVSWLLVDDVSSGRRMLNLSEWAQLDSDRQERKLRQICDQVTDGTMPLWFYVPLHPGSKFSSEDVKVLCDWTDAERERLTRAVK